MSIQVNDQFVAGRGSPALSPYQIAKSNGYSGTAEQFYKEFAVIVAKK